MTRARLFQLVEETREKFERAGWRRVRETHITFDPSIDNWTEGKRTVASCIEDGSAILLSPRLLSFDEARVRALLSHELGHAVQGFYGDAVRDKDAIERDADAIGERVLGQKIWYAPLEGRLIQTLEWEEGAVRPRPRGLRLGRWHSQGASHDRGQRLGVRPP